MDSHEYSRMQEYSSVQEYSSLQEYSTLQECLNSQESSGSMILRDKNWEAQAMQRFTLAARGVALRVSQWMDISRRRHFKSQPNMLEYFGSLEASKLGRDV